VVIVVVLFVALRGHACVTHDSHCSLSDTEMQLVRRLGTLEYHNVLAVNVADNLAPYVTAAFEQIFYVL
jgi:hypothetical protein